MLTDLKAKMENYVQSTAVAAELAHQVRKTLGVGPEAGPALAFSIGSARASLQPLGRPGASLAPGGRGQLPDQGDVPVRRLLPQRGLEDVDQPALQQHALAVRAPGFGRSVALYCR